MCEVIYAVPIPGIREPFSALSHVIGFLFFSALAVMLVRRGRGDRLRIISLVMMAWASIQMLIISSLYHSLWPGLNREFMLRADVAGIFFVISACYTPVHVILFTGKERWIPLAIAWVTAISGAILRVAYFDQLPAMLGIGIFLAFGWGVSATAIVLWCRYGWDFIRPAVLGGVSYTIGAVCLLMHGPTLINGVIGPHELWHVTVLTGLGLHWRFVFKFASGNLPEVCRPAVILPMNPLIVSINDTIRLQDPIKPNRDAA